MQFHLAAIVIFVGLALDIASLRGQDEPSSFKTPSGNPPNILFLLADDQRFDTIGAYGNQQVKTPNLDTLARSGVNFHNAYCFGSPHGAVCIPSRAMLHSGRTLFRLHNLDLEGHATLGELLQQGGYQTFGTGKWHNGKESFRRSFELGQNIMFGGMSNHAEVPLSQLETDTGKFSPPQVGEHFSSRHFADAAISFFQDRDQNRPFFCYVAFTAPHDPRMSPGNFNRMFRPEDMEVPPNFLPQHPFNNGDLTVRDEVLAPWPRTPEIIQAQTADYYGLIAHLDQQVGRIIEALRDAGLAENTLIIYAADHGLAMGSHGLLGKQNLYEHSVKAPLIMSGLGLSAKQDHKLIYLLDLFPTILELAGCPIPVENEGRSLVPAMLSRELPESRGVIFTTYKDTIRAVRDERWKLIRYPKINRTQLFDLETDPHEISDLSASTDPVHLEIAERLWKELAFQQKLVGDSVALTSKNPLPAEVDLTGRPRTPDQWQPRWIIEKYFDPTTSMVPAVPDRAPDP